MLCLHCHFELSISKSTFQNYNFQIIFSFTIIWTFILNKNSKFYNQYWSISKLLFKCHIIISTITISKWQLKWSSSFVKTAIKLILSSKTAIKPKLLLWAKKSGHSAQFLSSVLPKTTAKRIPGLLVLRFYQRVCFTFTQPWLQSPRASLSSGRDWTISWNPYSFL